MSVNFGAILTAMVTPVRRRRRASTRPLPSRLLHHLFENGSDGVVVCGTTGEAATLDDEEHLGFIELVVNEVRAAYPGKTVIAGVGSNDTRHGVELTERATAMRPDALLHRQPVLQPPVPARRDRALRGHRMQPPICRSCSTTSRSGPARTCPTICSPSSRSSRTSSPSSRPIPTTSPRSRACRSTPATTICSPTVLDLGEPGGILTGSHVVRQCRCDAWSSEQGRRHVIDASLARRLP